LRASAARARSQIDIGGLAAEPGGACTRPRATAGFETPLAEDGGGGAAVPDPQWAQAIWRLLYQVAWV
jgi:hypothetical protein